MNASLITGGDRPAIQLERHLPDPVEGVWTAVTDREQLRSWFPCDVVVAGGRFAVGAKITFVFPPEVIDLTLTGEVLAVDELHALAFTWGEETLRFELSPEEAGTRLLLVDELQAGWAARNAAGWETCLDRLAGGVPNAVSWRARFDAYVAEFEPSLGPQEGPPEAYRGE